jgi:hypothetical protein
VFLVSIAAYEHTLVFNAFLDEMTVPGTNSDIDLYYLRISTRHILDEEVMRPNPKCK